MAGSVYELQPVKSMTLELFGPGTTYTDDSVLTVAVADVLLAKAHPEADDYIDTFHRWFARYPNAGYGGTFFHWALAQERAPYNSYGNGSAMRVSPVSYAFDSLDEVLRQAAVSAGVTHSHPEGVKGAQAIAGAVFLARTGQDKASIRSFAEHTIGYHLGCTLDELRPKYTFDVSCQGSVPESILAFLESTDFEDALRRAISMGGDTDTMACMAGSIAEAFYGGVPAPMAAQAMALLDARMRDVLERFHRRFLRRAG